MCLSLLVISQFISGYSLIFGINNSNRCDGFTSNVYRKNICNLYTYQSASGYAQIRGCQFILCGHPVSMAVEHSVVSSDVLPQVLLAGYMLMICSD